MVGELVSHIRFGSGKVTAFEPPHIEVTFEEGAVKTFVYPQAVDRFIRFEAEEARQRAARDLELARNLERESAQARLTADRQRAEEAARQRMEQLHEKRVAAARRTAARRTKAPAEAAQ